MKTICIIDGQGGGIGSTIIKHLCELENDTFQIIALGTNAIATTQMLKAGANRGASGENAIVHTVHKADIIIGPLSIISANAMMGEITPKVAEAVSSSPARKYLLPITQENIEIVGVSTQPLPHLIQTLIKKSLSGLITETR